MKVFDIETDGLFVTKIHTISIYDTQTRRLYTYDKENVFKGIDLLRGQTVAGHNIIKFDIPAIQKLYPDFQVKEAIDTLLLSNFLFSNLDRKSVV